MLRLRGSLCLLAVFLLSACAPAKVELITGITEYNANEIISALYKSGIESVKLTEKDTSSVLVDPEYMAKSVELLNAQGLPSENHATLGDVFKKEGMISTPLEERARYIYALSQELERTLSQIDGVLVARVHLVLLDSNKIGQVKQKPSAAVFIKHLPELDPDTISLKIKRIVSRSVPGLNEQDPNSVSVSFIVSALKNVEIRWVDLWGFRMTEKSANKFRSTTKLLSIILVLITVIATAAVVILTLRKRRNDRQNQKAQQQQQQQQQQQPQQAQQP